MLIQHAGSNLAELSGVPNSDPCRFVVLGKVSHVAGDGELQDFPGVADVIN